MALAHALSAALEQGALQGTWITAERALAPLDPLLGFVARRRLKRLLDDARFRALNDDPSHVLWVAALLAVKPVPESKLDDLSAVRAELEAFGPRTIPKRFPWLTVGLVTMTLLLVLTGWVARGLLAPFDARATPAGRALGDGLTEFVATLGRDRSAHALARESAVGPRARQALGGDGIKDLTRLLDAAESLNRSSREANPTFARDAFLGATERMDATLARKKLPFFVDSDVLPTTSGWRPLLMSSYVEREVELVLGGQHVRALHLWRLDRLSLRMGALGYTRPRTPAALVLLDQSEEDLVRWVLPALPEGEAMELVDEETALEPEPWVTDVERRAAGVLRRHYAALGSDPAVGRVGQLLARRRALVKKWKASLSGQGIELVVPERLVPERDYAKELEIRITRENLREWDAIHDELLSRDVLAGFARIRDRYTLSVERHEAQHRFDYSRGFVPLPDLVARLLGVESPLDAPEGGLAASVRNEFSAYLAQLGTGPDSPLLDLVLMTRLSLSRITMGSAHSRAVIASLLAVGRELGIAPEPYFERGMRRRDVADLFLAIASHPPEKIRAGALSAYQKCFGIPLPSVTSRKVNDNTAWRH
jgi:hypothetical protein